MAYRFSLEPPGLVRHFLAHPPRYFEAALTPAGMPLFRAPFDLLTTLEPDALQWLRRVHLERLLRRALTWNTAFAGTTVSEYLPLPLAPADAGAVVDDLLATWHGDTALLILKDIPGASPLLPPAEQACSAALLQACEARGFLLVEGQALAWLDTAGMRSADDWLGSLSAGRRRDIRRKLRARARLHIECLATGSAQFGEPELQALMYRLYEEVHAQSEIHFDKLTPEFLAAVLQDGTIDGQVFMYRDTGGRLIGYNLCLVHGNRLVDKYIGLHYPDARAHNLYFVSWVQNLEYAMSRGLDAYVAGWTDPEIKAYLGAQFTFTQHAVYVRNPLLRRVLARLSHLFEGDRARFAADDGRHAISADT